MAGLRPLSMLLWYASEGTSPAMTTSSGFCNEELHAGQSLSAFVDLASPVASAHLVQKIWLPLISQVVCTHSDLHTCMWSQRRGHEAGLDT